MQALYTGLSGLSVNQTYLDVVGDNLANAQTVAFKGNRATFSDLLSLTVHSGHEPRGGLGGVDPMQVGRGVRVHSIDPDLRQGVLDQTGRTFDLAIEGSGFFVLSNATGDTSYTRAGTFGLDAAGFLTDIGTGRRVQGSAGDIQLDTGSLIPPKATGSVELQGNLPAEVTGPVREILSSDTAFHSGTSAAVLGEFGGPFNLDDGSGEPMEMVVRLDDGASQTVTFDLDAFADPEFATAEEVRDVIASTLPDAEVVVNNGAIDIRSRRSGSSSAIDIDEGRGSPASLLGLDTTPTRGESQETTAQTELNDLVSNQRDYRNGDTIEIRGTDVSGRTVQGTFTYGVDGTTMGSLTNFIDSLYDEATVTLESDGRIAVTASEQGEAALSLEISDGANSDGETDFEDMPFDVEVEGHGPDQARTSIEIFDAQGNGHTLSVVLERREENLWDLRASFPDEDGTIVDGTIEGIRFDEQGALVGATSDLSLRVSFEGAGQQDIELDLGEPGAFDGLTQFGDSTTAQAVGQDGYAEGELLSVGVDDDGKVNGFYSNGETLLLDELSLAFFANPAGLKRNGDNTFLASVNSGDPDVGTPGQDGRGTIRSGALETSNVDIAQEFVRMIEIQRTYQANARVIRASDQILSEAVNLV